MVQRLEKFDVKYSAVYAGVLCFEWRNYIHQCIDEIMGLFLEEN